MVSAAERSPSLPSSSGTSGARPDRISPSNQRVNQCAFAVGHPVRATARLLASLPSSSGTSGATPDCISPPNQRVNQFVLCLLHAPVLLAAVCWVRA